MRAVQSLGLRITAVQSFHSQFAVFKAAYNSGKGVFFSINARFTSKLALVMRDFKASDVAREVGLSRAHVAKRAQEIPGHRKTKGGHHRFRNCPALWEWIVLNKKPKRWRNVSDFMHEMLEYYDDAYLKSLDAANGFVFVACVGKAIEELNRKRELVVKHWQSGKPKPK